MTGVSVRISEMRTRVTLQSPTLTADAGGAQKATYATVTTVWARRVNAHGSEVLSDAAKASQVATLMMRYHATITAAWRVLMDGKAWQIIAPPDNVRDENRYTEIVVQLTEGTVE